VNVLSKRRCRGCDGIFIPKNSKQVYCSDQCRKADYRKKYYGQVEVKKICLGCGTTFVTTCPTKQSYCIPECRIANEKKRRDNKAVHRKARQLTYLGDRYETFKKDNFRCTVCGRSSQDGAALDIEEYEGGFRTVCKDCIVGKEVSEVG